MATAEMFKQYVLDELLKEFQYVALLPWQENLSSTVIDYAVMPILWKRI